MPSDRERAARCPYCGCQKCSGATDGCKAYRAGYRDGIAHSQAGSPRLRRGPSGHYAEHLSTHAGSPDQCATCLQLEAASRPASPTPKKLDLVNGPKVEGLYIDPDDVTRQPVKGEESMSKLAHSIVVALGGYFHPAVDENDMCEAEQAIDRMLQAAPLAETCGSYACKIETPHVHLKK